MILHATNMDDEALAAVCETKVPIVPTLTFQAVLADHGDKIGASAFLQDLFAKEIADSSRQLKAAHDAGVPLLCGTESGFSITPYGEWHWRELQVFVDDIGMAPAEALICATRKAAKVLGLSDIGTIEPGKRADLIVVDGDVTQDVTLLGRPGGVRHVFKAGLAIDIETPMPERTPLPSWRVSTYSTMIATRQAVLGRREEDR